MIVGESFHGFVLNEIRPSEELHADVYFFRHIKTGAELLWLKRDELNKTFCVSFKTIPENDTGVFHILEHSVLGGSAKYPVKDPFLQLLKSSLATFLNAMTFPDKTMYPVSSRNESDYLNLVDAYLDAVFAPSVYTNPNIFRQEGWHYEMRSPDDTPVYKGVVFNEMRGALSSVDEQIDTELCRLLFPDTSYRFVSGGDPVSIPSLTYDQFVEAHRCFYHPSNSMFFLDGDVPIDAVLEKIEDNYLCRYNRREPDFEVSYQKKQGGRGVRYFEIAPDETAAEKSHWTAATIAARWDEKEKIYALHMLCDVIGGGNESPLKQAILSRGLGQDLSFHLQDYIAQPYLCLDVQNTDPDKFDEIAAVTKETFRSLVVNGIPKEDLWAALNRLEFQLLEVDEPRGVELAIIAMNSWLYGGDPLMYLENKSAFESLRSKIDTDYFEKLLADTLLDEDTQVFLQFLPSNDLGETRRKAESDHLASIKASWSDEETSEIIAANLELDQWQQTAETAEQMKSIPQISLNDIPRDPEPIMPKVEQFNGLTVLRNDNDVAGITHVSLYFSAADLGLNDASDVMLMSSVLGELATKQHSAEELQREMKLRIGRISGKLEALDLSGEAGDVCRPFFVLRFSALEQELTKAVLLVHEILTETCFEDHGKILNILRQNIESFRETVISNGDTVGGRRAAASHSSAGALNESSSGIDAYSRMKRLEENFDSLKESISERMHTLCSKLFSRSRLIISITGNCPYDTLALLAEFPEGEAVQKETASYKFSGSDYEGIKIPAQISFASLSTNMRSIGAEYSGVWRLISHLVTYEYLWNEVRVKGGAYGTGMTAGRNGEITFRSFRDPSGEKTYSVYQKAGEFLKQYCSEHDSLDNVIVGAIGKGEPLQTARQKAITSDIFWLSGLTQEHRIKSRHELLDATPEQVIALADILSACTGNGIRCLVGADSVFENCSADIFEL